MMRRFLLCPLFCILFLFSNCKKETTQVVQPNRTILKTVLATDWKKDAASNTYYVDISVPEIDDKVVQTDAVQAYLTFDTQNIRYEALPDVLEASTIVCFHQKGLFTLEIQGTDGAIVSPPSVAIGLKIVLVDSE